MIGSILKKSAVNIFHAHHLYYAIKIKRLKWLYNKRLKGLFVSYSLTCSPLDAFTLNVPCSFIHYDFHTNKNRYEITLFRCNLISSNSFHKSKHLVTKLFCKATSQVARIFQESHLIKPVFNVQQRSRNNVCFC